MKIQDSSHQNLSENILKYQNIMQRYRNGEFGKNLHLDEILKAANESDLLNKLNMTEIQYLIDHHTGFSKMMFLELQKNKVKEEGAIKTLTLK